MRQSLKLRDIPPIPEVGNQLREVAERAAGTILKCGASIPYKVGIHVRNIDWWYKANNCRYINSYSHLSACKYLRSLDAANSPAKDFYFLTELKYLESLKIGRYKTYYSKDGRGPTNESIRKNFEGIGCYAIERNPLYRRLGKKRDKPLPGFTDIEWLTKLTLLRDLSIEVHDVLDLTPLSELEDLEILKLHGAKSPSLEMVSQLTSLKELELYNCAIDDLSALGRFHNLTKLTIDRCGIELLSNLPESLNYFWGNRNYIKDVILPGNLPNLSKFTFGGSEITGKSIGLDRFT